MKKETKTFKQRIIDARLEIQSSKLVHDSKGQFNNKYISLEGIQRVVEPILLKHGLFTQFCETDVIDTKIERDGNVPLAKFELFIRDSESDKLSVHSINLLPDAHTAQKKKSALTYAMRTLYAMALCFPVDRDDDGAAASYDDTELAIKIMSNAKKEEPAKFNNMVISYLATIAPEDWDNLVNKIGTKRDENSRVDGFEFSKPVSTVKIKGIK